MSATYEQLKARLRFLRVDRANSRLRGYIVCETGDFKDGRGHFSLESLQKVCDLINATPNGVKSHFGHDNQLGKFLGRTKNAAVIGPRVRADLHFDKTAMELTPVGNTPLGKYVMDLAESDPDALNASLVLGVIETPRGSGGQQEL